MSNRKTNTIKGDARERTKKLENITIIETANKNLQSSTSVQTNILTFTNNRLTSTNNHENLLKATHGFYDLEPCCDLSKEKATSLDDGLKTKINVNLKTTLAKSSCNRAPLYDANNCNTPMANMLPNMTKNNFNYPVPINKNTCCSQDRAQPNIKINSTQNHTKYIPVMSKIKKYQYRTTDTIDPIQYPNFNTVNKNNLVNYFKDDVYRTTSCSSSSSSCSSSCSSSTSTSTSTSVVGHKLKYSVQNTDTNCSCSDYDDYKIQTSSLNQPTPAASTSNSSYFSRKWSKSCC